MSLVHNERQKLLAGNLDRLSNASAIIGVVPPVIAWRYGFPTAPPWTVYSVDFSEIWFLTAVSLHFLARRTLQRLRA
ncbi:hypothetical protein [Methylobacterium haplocladii]|uniref:Uncharacterized protein n=1 Tax=Methylobacterium haplocladii TaxID=1176176 RepID=A0A512IRS5_9HYPH|nr:hypothetical protein [Methylobacterium haplocladii]GEP00408.1 hypothetical protein MHA02_27950 [Methylobacterium haplocladii]GJD82572.1 hypothetical protein HPGCJGGD_0430 [Methylobacterium haplocladii]GLS58809.1 hypothetical protein GCM10007887_14750 [Methylobacterium haplocladii]